MLLFIDSAVLARHCGGAADSEAASSAAAVRSAASCARHRSWRSDDAGRRWRLRCFADEELRLLTRSAAAASRVPSASTRCDVESSWPPRVPHAVFSLRCGEWWLRRRAVVGASTTAHALRLPAPQPACRRHRRSTPSKRALPRCRSRQLGSRCRADAASAIPMRRRGAAGALRSPVQLRFERLRTVERASSRCAEGANTGHPPLPGRAPPPWNSAPCMKIRPATLTGPGRRSAPATPALRQGLRPTGASRRAAHCPRHGLWRVSRAPPARPARPGASGPIPRPIVRGYRAGLSDSSTLVRAPSEDGAPAPSRLRRSPLLTTPPVPAPPPQALRSSPAAARRLETRRVELVISPDLPRSRSELP